MIPLVLIGLSAAWLSHRVDSEIQAAEDAAIHSLATIAQAQRQIHQLESIDSNEDGSPEFGWFRELTGASLMRHDSDGDGIADADSDRRADPAVLGPEFGHVDQLGQVLQGGYLFLMVLPGENGEFLIERNDGGVRPVSGDLAGRYWACLAWPLEYGKTGRRTFYINQSGDIVSTDNPNYSGRGRAPLPWAALRKGRFAMRNAAVHPDECNDGGTWNLVF